MITKPTRFYRDGGIFATSTHSLGSWVMVARPSRPATPARPSSGSVLGEKRFPGGTDVFLDSYAAAASAALWAAIVFHPSDLLIFSSRYHTMYSSRARTKLPFVVPFQSLA